MKAVNKTAKRILDNLTFGVDAVNTHKKINNAEGAFMAVSVNWLGKCEEGNIYSVAHYGKQNGDLMADPDVEFLKGIDGNYYPISIRNDYVGSNRVAVNFKEGKVFSFSPREQKDIALFCGMWMKNIEEQQAVEIDGRKYTVLQQKANYLAGKDRYGWKLLLKKVNGKKLFLATKIKADGKDLFVSLKGCPSDTALV